MKLATKHFFLIQLVFFTSISAAIAPPDFFQSMNRSSLPRRGSERKLALPGWDQGQVSLFEYKIELKDLIAAIAPNQVTPTTTKRKYQIQFNNDLHVQVEVDGPFIDSISFYNSTKEKIELAKESFFASIKNSNLKQLFFYPNLSFEEESLVESRLSHRNSIVDPMIPSSKIFRGLVQTLNQDEVVFIPDRHGVEAYSQLIKNLILAKQISWLAFEMLSQDMQSLVDTYLEAKDSSELLIEIEEKLTKHFGRLWNHENQKDFNQISYFRILKLCREQGVAVIAIDADSSYLMRNPRPMPLNMGTRNLIWVKKIPVIGRGVVFGGHLHFSWFPGVRVQDFFLELYPERPYRYLVPEVF